MSRYIEIKPCDIANGLGCRVVIFFSGCQHHCKGCHNPQTWDRNNGEIIGRRVLDKLREYLKPDYIRGITLSGGDPLMPENRTTAQVIVDMVREEFPKKDIWLYTGYTYEECKEYDSMIEVIKQVDVLVDGPYIEELHDISYPYAGSTNQRLIDMRKTDPYDPYKDIVLFDYKEV